MCSSFMAGFEALIDWSVSSLPKEAGPYLRELIDAGKPIPISESAMNKIEKAVPVRDMAGGALVVLA